MKVLIAGVAGYAGSLLAEKLLSYGMDVRGVDNFLRNHGNALLNLSRDNRFEFIYGDITNETFIKQIVNDVDAIVWLSALVGQPVCDRHYHLATLVNCHSTELLCRNVTNNTPIIFASTGSVYGSVEGICTEATPTNPLSHYAVTKLFAEKNILQKEKSTVLRFSTACGVSLNLRFDLLVNDLVYHAVRDRTLTIFQADYQRSFIDVEDFCDAIHFVLTHRIKHRIYNIGNDDGNWTKRQLAEHIKEKTGCHITYADKGYEDPDKRCYSISHKRINDEGWRAWINIPETVDSLIRAVKMLPPGVDKL